MTKAFCTVSIAPVRAEGKDEAEIVTQLLFGELVQIVETNFPWTKIIVLADNYSGYIDHKHIQKLNDDEVQKHLSSSSPLIHREIEISSSKGIQRICRGSYFPVNEDEFQIGKCNFKQVISHPNIKYSLISLAQDYLNTPYLWGGKSPFGIDCSGITQVIFSIMGIKLPRDASQQVQLGDTVKFEEIKTGDLAFFSNKKGNITHVGILDGEGNIIHAAGHVRKDAFSSQGIINSETSELTHQLTCIKRPY